MEAPGAPFLRYTAPKHMQASVKVGLSVASVCLLAVLVSVALLQGSPSGGLPGDTAAPSHRAMGSKGSRQLLMAPEEVATAAVITKEVSITETASDSSSPTSSSTPTSSSAASSSAEEEVPWAKDAACVSSFPSLCKFVNALPIPRMIDGATNTTVHLGIYDVWASVHRDVPKTKWYGYGETAETATTPGPTIVAVRNIETHVQWSNHLTDESYLHSVYAPPTVIPKNGGIPVVMHLHGGETEPASDGHPYAWFTSRGEVGDTFVKSLYTYHNGQDAATLWYHDHTMGLTQLSTYYGLAGFYIITDPEAEKGYNLPSGEFDIPINILNKVLNIDGTLHVIEDEDAVEQVSQEMTTANNAAWPYLDVQRTKYRFRILNSDSLRRLNLTFMYVDPTAAATGTYGLNFTLPTGGRFISAHQIATDSSYTSKPVEVTTFPVAPAERIEVVFDFDIADATDKPFEVYLVNYGTLEINEYGLPVDTNLGVIMKFRVSTTRVASSPLPAVLLDLPDMKPETADVTRYLALIETPLLKDRVHVLGGKRWPEAPTEIVNWGTSEVWYLINETPQIHTIHLHLTKFRVVGRQQFDIGMYRNGTCSLVGEEGKPACYKGEFRSPHPTEYGWKDTVAAGVEDVTTIMFNIRSNNGGPYPFDATAYPGYVWHCHIAEHEDFEMMRPFLVVPAKAPWETEAEAALPAFGAAQ